MEFAERIQVLVERVPSQLAHIQSEEGTKNSLVLPFIAALGYNVFDSGEVTTDYPPAVGLVKEQTADYSVLRNGKPILFFECFPHTGTLDAEPSPFLQRLFQKEPSALAVLTNGLRYRFYSDLETPNRLDRSPFYEFDLLHTTPRDIRTLAWFSKSGFDPEAVLGDLRKQYLVHDIQEVMRRQLQQPSDEFLRFLATQVPIMRASREVKAQFPLIVQRALQQWVEIGGGVTTPHALPRPTSDAEDASEAPALTSGPSRPSHVRKLQAGSSTGPTLPPPDPAPPPARSGRIPLLWLLLGLAIAIIPVVLYLAPRLTAGLTAPSGEPIENRLILTEEIEGAETETARGPEAEAAPTRLALTQPSGEPRATVMEEGTASLPAVAPVSTTVRIPIIHSADDAEEDVSSGEMNLASRDLEMTGNSDPTAPQLVGLRFQDVPVPPGATIERAYLSFIADEPGQDPTTLFFQGEATADAPPFEWEVGNISRRSRTDTTVAWNSIPAWFRAGDDHISPDLTGIVQEIVDLDRWEAGNAIVLIVTGTGERTVASYDNDPEAVPVLHIEFVEAGAEAP